MSDGSEIIKGWFLQKLKERRIGTATLTLKAGNRITSATIFRWYSGRFFPTTEKMRLICDTLSQLPIIEKGKPPRYEEVSLLETMLLFGPKPKRSRSTARR